MSEFCEQKDIKREFSVAKTPQQNGVAERRNRTLIEADRTMVLVVKPHNKTPYELFRGKFDGKSDEEFFVRYSLNSKAFRVHNNRTRKVEENLHIRFLDDKPIIAGNGPKWMFDMIDAGKKDDEGVNKESGIDDQDLNINTVSPTVTTAPLEATHADFFGDETEVDMSNITTTYLVSSTPNTRIHKDHSLDHVIGDVQSGVQTRRMTKTTNKQGRAQKGNLSIKRSKLDRSYARRASAVQVTTGLDLGGFTTWQKSHWIEAIRLFLAYASFKDFVVYQMDVKSAFLYGKIEEEVYVCQPLGFEDPEFPDRVYKVEKALYGLHQAPRAWSKPKLGLWYPKDSPFDLEAYIDSDYASASLDRKSTTGGCQFLRSRLISWQCKKQTIVSNSTTEVEYVAVAIKNLVFHSKTKHIEIRHYFIRDSNEKKLIQMIKIHTDQNVTDLLTKAFDVGRFQYLIASIGILNL
ncbi:retrovirus-related pol polyprotein from transposon TNT 1-94 [Tanacetum coccineum]